MEKFVKCPFCLSFFKESDFEKHLKEEGKERSEYRRKVISGKYNFGNTSSRRALNKRF